MPKIQNLSKSDVTLGWHWDAGADAMLIRIWDPGSSFGRPHAVFQEIHGFEFLDAEDTCGFADNLKIQPAQAQAIVALLQKALARNQHVLVQCTMGVSRSGAIVAVAELMGFEVVPRPRQPNARVKRMLLEALGRGYGGCGAS